MNPDFTTHSAVVRVPRLVQTETVRMNVKALAAHPVSSTTDFWALAVDICKPDNLPQDKPASINHHEASV